MTPMKLGAGVEAVHNGECVVFSRCGGTDEIMRMYMTVDQFEGFRTGHRGHHEFRRLASEAIAERAFSGSEAEMFALGYASAMELS